MPTRSGKPSKTVRIKRALKRRGMSEERARRIAAAARRKQKMRSGKSYRQVSKEMAKSAARTRKKRSKKKIYRGRKKSR